MPKTCSKCKIDQPIENFSVSKRNENGDVVSRNSWCNKCRTKGNRERLGHKEAKRSVVDLENKTKECMECHQILGFDMFYPAKRGSAGLAAYCNSCFKKKFYDKSIQRKYVSEYRKRNLFYWRALHRVHQYNRRNKIKATQDGTVTKEFAYKIYAMEICYWCKEFVEEDDRTMEHIIELSNGGAHSASNITMSCFSCNSSRPNRNVK